MRNGIGPQKLGVSKENRVADVKTMAHKTTNPPGKGPGKGLKETTEVGKGYSGSEYLAERKRVRANAISDFKTKNSYAPGRKVGEEEMSLYINPKVRKTLKETGYTERGVRRKSDNTRVNPSNL